MRLLTLSPEALDAERYTAALPAAVRSQARAMAFWDGVDLVSLDRRRAVLKVGTVRRNRRTVEVTLKNNQVEVTCTCPQCYLNENDVCVNKAAAVIYLSDILRTTTIIAWDTMLSRITEQPSQRRASSTPTVLVFSLQEAPSGWKLVPYAVPAAHVPEQDWNNAEKIHRHLKKENALGSVRGIRSASRRFVNATPEAARAVPVLGSLSQLYAYDDAHSALVFGGLLYDVMTCPLFVGEPGEPLGRPLKVLTEPATPAMRIQRSPEGMAISLELRDGETTLNVGDGQGEIISEEPLWVLYDQTLISSEISPSAAVAFLQYNVLDVPEDEVPTFLGEYLGPVAEQIQVIGDGVTWDEIRETPEKRLYLADDGQEGLQATLRFGYGPYELDYEKDAPETSVRVQPGSTVLARIHRDRETEDAAHQAMGGFRLKRGGAPGEFALRARVQPVDFLLREVPRLAEAGFVVYGEEALTAARINRSRPTLSFNVSSGIDWFDVGAVVSFGDLKVDLKTVRRAIRRRERFLKLADGSIGVLPEEWLDRYRRLLGLGEETDDGLRFSRQHALLLDQMLADAEGETDEAFQKQRDRLRDFTAIAPVDAPKGFHGELRPYQKTGYDWLHFLRSYGFGGILADDMGLGKTAEALAFLVSLRERGETTGPDLIVMPRSLLFNWQREAARFTPSLKVLIHADKDRAEDLSEFDGYDLVLTTYGIMLRDIEALRARRFHYVVLDESQAIKNPLSQTARAARLLRADHRLALTGTPVENTTTELWSQFAFLNPGLLGGLEFFRSEFAGPIERKQNTEAADTLRRIVYPFILRRTKAQVAPELPPRTERVLVVDMEPTQRRMYDKWRDVYRAQVLGLIEGEDMSDARMKILEGLLRLRQICNDPRTIDAKYKGGSGKFEALLETMETLREEGHKALVFSQFVQMLDLVRRALDQRGIPYAYLDGSTRDRQAQVDAFQANPDLPFFLVSLKAGGVGLNLTAADYVIHIDPWWNPAVEMQATDRTHRIGQDKPVFIYKMITRDSVEEKILDLQARKRALVDQLVGVDSGMLKSLTREDVEALFD